FMTIQNAVAIPRALARPLRKRPVELSANCPMSRCDPTSAPADSGAVQWVKLKVQADNSLVLDSTGRIYDGTSTPYFYYVPSIAVNASGDMLMGLAGSKLAEHIGGFVTGIRASDGASPLKPILVQAGRDYFYNIYRGDYTATF